jgi:protease-4
MRCYLAAVCLILPASGCLHPVKLVTDNRVVVEMPPVGDGGPVSATFTPGHPLPCGTPRIAVVDVDGLLANTDFTGPSSLGENPVALFRERLDAVAADHDVCGVVLRVNSPGGSVTATDIMWHDLTAFRQRTRLPVVACLLDVGAGGGYYLATASDVIVAHPTTVTGGIGVILNLYNLREMMAQFNILSQEVKSGHLIDMGTPTRNLTEEARHLLQKMADEYHQRFIEVVLHARPKVQAGDRTNFDGRVFLAREAHQRGLIDQVGYLDDAITLAGVLGHHPCAAPVFYRRHNDPGHGLYASTPNTPLQATAWPIAVPGLDRSRLPAFLYLWQPETTLERVSGR